MGGQRNISDENAASPATFDLAKLEGAILGTPVFSEAPAARILVEAAGVGTLRLLLPPPCSWLVGRQQRVVAAAGHTDEQPSAGIAG